MQREQQLLTGMRMVCDSTYLVDEATNDSPKLEELKYILLDKLDLANLNRKVIIFSEWVKVHKLIGKMLLENKIGFTELNGSVPVKKRGELIRQFEENTDCKVFLSTEAGGSGLNLQVADILINFEVPWNPAKKNQRIGRIDRLGQKSNKLTIYNLITLNSIEQRIAEG
jgi:SNF2 family DNA or RNA helicase